MSNFELTKRFLSEDYLDNRTAAIRTALFTVAAGLGQIGLHYAKAPEIYDIADWAAVGVGALRTAFFTIEANSSKRMISAAPETSGIGTGFAPPRSPWS